MKAAATLPPALSVQGLGKAYGERAVFHDLSFTLESGAVSYTHLTLPTILLV